MKLRMSITCIMMTLSKIGNNRIVGSLKLGCMRGSCGPLARIYGPASSQWVSRVTDQKARTWQLDVGAPRVFSRVVMPDRLEFFKKRGGVKSKSLEVSSQKATCTVETPRRGLGSGGRPEPYGWHAPVPLAPSPSFGVFTSPSLACGCPSLGRFLSKSLCGLQRVSAPHSSYPSPKMSSWPRLCLVPFPLTLL